MSLYLLDTDWIIDALHEYGTAMQTLVDLDSDGLALSLITYGERYEGASMRGIVRKSLLG